MPLYNGFATWPGNLSEAALGGGSTGVLPAGGHAFDLRHALVNSGTPFDVWSVGHPVLRVLDTPLFPGDLFALPVPDLNTIALHANYLASGYRTQAGHTTEGINGICAVGPPPPTQVANSFTSVTLKAPLVLYANVTSYDLYYFNAGVETLLAANMAAGATYEHVCNAGPYVDQVSNTYFMVAHLTDEADIGGGAMVGYTAHRAPKQLVAYNTAAFDNPETLHIVVNPDRTLHLTWDFGSPVPGATQSAYQIEILNIDASVYSDTGKVVDTVADVTTAALPPAHYYLGVRLWDNYDVVAPYNAVALIVVGNDPPTLDNLRINGGIPTTDSTPLVEWDYHDVNGDPQGSKRVRVVNCLGVEVFNSDWVNDAVHSLEVTPALDLNMGYVVYAAVKDSLGAASAEAALPFRALADGAHDLPNPPANMVVTSAAGVKDATIAWDFTHPQVATMSGLRVVVKHGATLIHDSGAVASVVPSYHIPVRMAPGNYTVTITQQDSFSLVSCPATFDLVVTNTAPTVTGLHMVEANPTFNPHPSFAWAHNDDAGDSMRALELVITSRDGLTTFYDSGTVLGAANSYAVPEATLLISGLYTAKVRVQDEYLAWGAYATVDFEVQGVCPVGQHWNGTACVANGDNPYCCARGYVWSDSLGRCVPGEAMVTAPAKPDPPIVLEITQDHIKMGSPPWPPIDGLQPIESMDIYREGVVGAIGHWDAPGGFVLDTDIINFGSYRYRVQAHNRAGDSPFSDWAGPVVVQSATCVVVVMEPVDGAELYGLQRIRYSVTDAGGASNQHVTIDGKPMSRSTLLRPGDNFSGVWFNPFETRDYLQGYTELTGLALGSDNLWARDVKHVTLANTPRNNPLYMDVGPLTNDDAAQAFYNNHVGVETPALSIHPRYQWWAFLGVRSWSPPDGDPIGAAPTTPEEALAQFNAHQLVTLTRGPQRSASGLRPERHIYYGVPRLKKPGLNVAVRLQLIERELALAWKLAPSTRVVKVRESTIANTMVVFGDTPATLWTWDGDKHLIKDLSTVNAGASTDAAVIDDHAYIIVGGELRVVDTTPTDTNYRLFIQLQNGLMESRPPVFVERVKTEAVVLCVDGLQDPATVAYKVTGGDITPLWTIPGAATHTDVSTGDTLAIAVGHELWRAPLDGAAVLAHTFPANITALDAYRVGLANGEVWGFDGLAWNLDTTVMLEGVPESVAAVGAWNGAAPILRGVVAPVASAQTFEQADNGAWGVGRLVVNPSNSDDTVTDVLALRRYVRTTKGTDGTDTTEEQLLIGTGNDGLLIAVSLAPISEASGAFLMTDLSTIDISFGGNKVIL